MTKSDPISIHYARKNTGSREDQLLNPAVRSPKRRAALIALFSALALAAYCAPWLLGSGTATSLTGYDLAEWSSLVPGVRYGAEPMLIPGLLRAQLMIIAVLLALIPPRRGTLLWWACGAGAAALVVAQLPPFEYFLESSWRADVNYGQQVTLAILSVLDVAICWALPRRAIRPVVILIAAAGVITAVAGLSKALGLAAGFDTPVVLGPGVVGYVSALIGAAVAAVIPDRAGR